MAQHGGGSTPPARIGHDQVVGRGSRPVSSRRRKGLLSGPGWKPRAESTPNWCPVEHLGSALADSFGVKAVAGDGTEVVDPGLLASPALKAIVQQEFETEQEEGVEILEPVAGLERLVLQPTGPPGGAARSPER